MTTDRTTASWDTRRRTECAVLLHGIAADCHRLADETSDPDDRRALRAAEAGALDAAHEITGPGVAPGTPDRLAGLGRDLAAAGEPAGCQQPSVGSGLGADLVRTAASLRTFYVPAPDASERGAIDTQSNGDTQEAT